MARLLPCWLGYRSVLVRIHVSVGVWSAGLGIINRGSRWGWSGPGCDLEPPESVPCWPDVPSTCWALECPGLEHDPCWPTLRC